jgi:3-oxoacyl-[acyl-carrier-protein] synthase II
MDNRVVITGTGLVTSLGLDVSDTWKALLSGKTGIQPVKDFDVSGFGCTSAAHVNGLPGADLGIHPRDSRIMDKHSFMLMKGSRDALKHAGLDVSTVAPEDTGYFAGMGMVDYDVDDLMPGVAASLDSKGELDYDRFYSDAYQEVRPLWPLSMLNNISFCQVAIDLGIKGENSVFAPHSDSGMNAVIEGYNTLKNYKARAVLAGGVSEKISPLSIARASVFNIINTAAETGCMCQPFALNRAGTLLGEGCGMIVMEKYSSAVDRTAPVMAVVKGYGTSFGKLDHQSCPSPDAISDAMRKALALSHLDTSDIDVIIAHGDGTPHGDGNEITAVNQTFKGCFDKLKIYSSKSALGHMLSGSSPVDMVLGIQMLNHGIIPAIYGSYPFEKNMLFRAVTEKTSGERPGRILINSSSYEGQCASLVLEGPEL